MRALLLTLLATIGLTPLADGGAQAGGRAIAVRAGTIHTVEGKQISNGTILIRGGQIVDLGEGIEIPADATIVDYGPDAVIVPGFVAAMSYYASGSASKRSADPDVRAVDGFDPYRKYYSALSAGVTSAYISPADSRLISGQGGLVKLAGDDHARRIVNEASAIHGAVDSAARSAPGYWEPPVPVTVDVGIGSQTPQLPKTTMGAIVALDELMALGRSGDGSSEYGPRAPMDFVRMLDRGVPLRLGAVDHNEILAVLEFAAQREVRIILDKANDAGGLATEIAKSGVSVIFRVPYTPNSRAFDRGKGEDSRWYQFGAPAKLDAAGVSFAITGSNPRDLLFVAGLAMRGGLDGEAALRAITLTPAQMLGGGARIGSLGVGKDADLCILNGQPMSGNASVLATYVDGEKVWWHGMAEAARGSGTAKPMNTRAAKRARARSVATVIEVEELHVGDGEVLSPGQILMRDGKIAEVSTRVSHPPGASVVRGKAAMPGMIDAFGHLGLEGSKKIPGTDYALTSIVEPGDDADRRVASHGITTVVMTPRGASGSGSPVMAYKPAGEDLESQVIGDPVALRLRWRASSMVDSGSGIAKLLKKASDYRTAWEEYNAAMAKWVPPPEEPEESTKKDDDEEEEAKEEEKDDKKKKKKKKRKKGEEEELEPDPLTGEWTSEIDSERFRLRLLFENPGGSGPVEGTLRCDVLSETLIEVSGDWNLETRDLTLWGRGSRGTVDMALKPKEGKLEGEIKAGEETYELELERKSKEYPSARRPERRAEEKRTKKAAKGTPKAPKRDPKLDPIVSAMAGDVTIVVEVHREDEITDCVKLFGQYGIRPVLYGAGDAHHVADDIASKVAGVLLAPSVLVSVPDRGSQHRRPYSELQQAGISVAFMSESEEGAIDLPLRAAYAVSNGMSPSGAVRALTADAAEMMSIEHRVGRLAVGLDADVVLLDGTPMAPGTSVLRTWVNGEEVKP